MSSSLPTSATTSAVATATVTMSTSPVPSPTPPTTPNNTTSLFNPEPTDNQNNCICSKRESCFVYSGGFICQPFTSNKITSPPTPGVPAAWFLAENYPSVRYTMSVVNQTAGANCTTITTPPARFYSALAQHISMYDLGGYYLDLERQYSSTLFQYRGNCADAFYCRPNNLPMSQAGTSDQSIQGNLPGTCQPLVAEGGDCLASSMCQGWHIAPDYTYNNDQFRCSLNTGMGDVNHPAGICKSLGLGSGKVNFNDGSFIQQTARTYILSAMLIFCLAFLYLWYRRQKARQMQQRMMMDAQGQSYYYDNTAVYLSRGGGVNRQPDDNDNELPAYGQHRRDERVTGPAAEEIGMYSFASGPPASPSPYPAAAVRPTQHTYPFSTNHPAFVNPTLPIPSGALYPPPQSPPPPPMGPPMSAAEAEAAALSAAAAAAIATPVPAHQPPVEEARQVVEGGLPPAYDGVAPGTDGEKDPKRKGDEETDPFEGSSSGSSARSTPDLERSKEKARQDDHDSTRSGGSSRGPDSGRH
ncbi:hypothetical protein CPB97_011991 [Podila verticillata]|nr:hypothetical protein CPB97_011991 [Podila verticillata]